MWDKLKLRRPRKSHVGPRTLKKKDGPRDARALLAGSYDLSEDEGASDQEIEQPVQGTEDVGIDDEDDDDGEEVCIHTFIPPPGVFV